jgi:hypothetical protein
MVAWLLGATHVTNVGDEIARIFAAIAASLFQAAVLWLMYLGLEPYVRRAAPASLIGWTRLVGGRWRDPHVGMDVLAGVSAGLLMTLFYVGYYLLPGVLGWPDPMPAVTDIDMLRGLRYLFAGIADRISGGVTSAMFATLGIVAVTILVRRRVPGAILSTILFTPVALNGMFSPGYPGLALLMATAIFGVLAAVTLRFGLLAAITTVTVHFLLLRVPLTTELTSWRGGASIGILATIAALGLAGVIAARSGDHARAAADLRIARA